MLPNSTARAAYEQQLEEQAAADAIARAERKERERIARAERAERERIARAEREEKIVPPTMATRDRRPGTLAINLSTASIARDAIPV